MTEQALPEERLESGAVLPALSSLAAVPRHPCHRHRLGPVIGRGAVVRLDRSRFHLNTLNAANGAVAMQRWRTEVGGQWLRRRICRWAARLGEREEGVDVRDLSYRWGSARPTNGHQRINIQWAALQLPPSFIDYVLVHELAHLREINHPPEFWSTVARLMPTYELHKTTLASIGKNWWLGSVATEVQPGVRGQLDG